MRFGVSPKHGALLLIQCPEIRREGKDCAGSTNAVIIIVVVVICFIGGEILWIKSLNSILQLQSTFPGEIPLHFIMCGIAMSLSLSLCVMSYVELRQVAQCPSVSQGL